MAWTHNTTGWESYYSKGANYERDMLLRERKTKGTVWKIVYEKNEQRDDFWERWMEEENILREP